jgi:enoyl-CoA hydratase
VPHANWPALIATLCATGDWDAVDRAAHPAPASPLAADQAEIDRLFGGDTIRDVINLLKLEQGDLARRAMAAITRGSPLSVACTLELVHRARLRDTIEHALEQEHRFTYRAQSEGDFLEGVRAAIIDKDKTPHWRHAGLDQVSPVEIAKMLMPLGTASLRLETEGSKS